MSFDSPYILALCTQTIIFVTVACLIFLRRRESAFSPMLLYLAFHFVVFVLRPWIEWTMRLDLAWGHMGFHPILEDRVRALGVSSAALIFIALGYLFKMRRSFATFGAPHLPRAKATDLKALLFVLVPLVPLVLYSIWVTRTGIGLSDRSSVAMKVVDGVIVNTDTTGYITDVQNAMLGLVGISLVFRKYRWITLSLLSVYMARKVMTGGGRWGIVLPLASYALIYMHYRKIKWPPVSFAFLAIPIVLLFVTLGEDRYFFSKTMEGRSYEIASKSGEGLRERLDTLDFANFDYLTYVTSVVPRQSGTYTYGTQYLQLLTEPVPRIFWPGKPAGPPIKLVDLNSYGNFFGLTLSLPGDLWMSLGWLGVVLGGFSVGVFIGNLYDGFLSGRWDIYKKIAYLMALPLFIQFYRDGGIVSFTKFVGMVVLPVLVVSWLAKRSVNVPTRRADRNSQGDFNAS